jgi:hypothetical protein
MHREVMRIIVTCACQVLSSLGRADAPAWLTVKGLRGRAAGAKSENCVMGSLDMASPPHPKGMLITDAKVARLDALCMPLLLWSTATLARRACAAPARVEAGRSRRRACTQQAQRAR